MKWRQYKLFLNSLTKLSSRSLYHLVLRTGATRPPEVAVVKTPHGTFCGLPNDYLFQHAIANGTNEEHFDELTQNLLQPDDVVLDVGGNIGTHAISLSKKVPQGQVYTFDPQSLVFSILQNNLLMNGCKNVTAYRFAISDRSNDTISMQPFSFVGDVLNNGALRIDLDESLGDLALTRTLDSFQFDRVNFIKLDIQGSEMRALAGAKSLIKMHRPYLFVEVEEQYLRAFNSTSKELLETLLAQGYALYRFEIDNPCDHVCVPLEKVEHFEQHVLPNLSYPLSKKICGEKVELKFKSDADQTYSQCVAV